MAHQVYRALLARAALASGLVLAPACLDWQALYDGPCEGASCASGVDGGAADDASMPRCTQTDCDATDLPAGCDTDSCTPATGDGGGPEQPCGNGKVEDDEECDDGNTVDTDACRTNCLWARCGDGVVRENVEDCDDGNSDDATCSAECMVCAPEPGQSFLWTKTGHCYSYDTSAKSFAEASAACAARGVAYLATLNVAAEEAELFGSMQSDKSRTFWLGLRRTGDNFSWLGGGPANRTFWDKSQPADQPADCVAQTVMTAEDVQNATTDQGMRGYFWRAEDCDAERPFVCERAPAMVRSESNHAYFAGFHLATWPEARELCAQHGAHLATLNSEAEHGFASLASAVNMWIGGESPDEPGSYQWITGEPFNYDAFAPWDEHVDDETQRCMLLSYDGFWYDKECDARYGYLCEID